MISSTFALWWLDLDWIFCETFLSAWMFSSFLYAIVDSISWKPRCLAIELNCYLFHSAGFLSFDKIARFAEYKFAPSLSTLSFFSDLSYSLSYCSKFAKSAFSISLKWLLLDVTTRYKTLISSISLKFLSVRAFLICKLTSSSLSSSSTCF